MTEDSVTQRLRGLYHRLVARSQRLQRRERREFRRWIATTTNLTHLTTLVVVPVVIATVTVLADRVPKLSFLLYPPLASATYTLFDDPMGRYSSPKHFVGGLASGAVCGWASVAFSEVVLGIPRSSVLHADPVAAAISVFLTISVTWVLSLELPAAFSTALLAVVVGVHEVTYVLSVVVSSIIVTTVFSVWRRAVYERRSQYLYRTTKGDDHVLVPMLGEDARATATFGARLAAAHDAGKVVLLDAVDRGSVETTTEPVDDVETELVDPGDADAEEAGVADEVAKRLEEQANRIETKIGVPCEVIVVRSDPDPAGTVIRTARETNCDLIVAPYDERDGTLSPFVRGLFRGSVDTIAFRSAGETEARERWKRVLVSIRRPSELAHAMIEFALRVAGLSGRVSVCTCIAREGERRTAETMLANLVGAFEGSFETRVSQSSVESFLESNDDYYDLTVIGASTDRSAASRFLSVPTFERIDDLDCDVAVVHLG